MPKITVLPHTVLCPELQVLEGVAGTSLCDALLAGGIAIEHACEKSCACTTCHVIVRQGYDNLAAASEKEEDLLDMAWGLEAQSRLACQVRLPDADITVEIPKYSLNHARENDPT